jgi:hypothetical protein
MACTRCDFYTLTSSTKVQFLEAKDNLQRTLVAVSLSDDERDAIAGHEPDPDGSQRCGPKLQRSGANTWIASRA